jgi:hypothetical protein
MACSTPVVPFTASIQSAKACTWDRGQFSDGLACRDQIIDLSFRMSVEMIGGRCVDHSINLLPRCEDVIEGCLWSEYRRDT